MPGASSADLGHDFEYPARFPDAPYAPLHLRGPRDPNQHPATAGQHAGRSDAERQEKITQLLLRRSKLSTDEAALLRQAELAASPDRYFDFGNTST